LFFEVEPQFLDLLGDMRGTDINGEKILMEFLQLGMPVPALMQFPPIALVYGLVDVVDGWVPIKSLGDNVTFFRRAVTYTAKVKTLVVQPLKDSRPLGGLERDAVGACKARRDKSDAS
jgi:hypothetical protein